MCPKIANTNDVWGEKGMLGRPGLYTEVYIYAAVLLHNPAVSLFALMLPVRSQWPPRCSLPSSERASCAGAIAVTCERWSHHRVRSGTTSQCTQQQSDQSALFNQPGNCMKHLAPAKQDHLPTHGYDTRLSLNTAGCGDSHSIRTASF